MRQSQIFSTTRREIPKDETSKNAILLTRGGYIDKELAGVYTLLPLGLRIVEKIKTIVRDELNKLPHTSEISMPVLQPHALWEESGRREKIKEIMYDLKDEPLGLGPTHEEIITDMFRRFYSSYKDLPKAAYQIQTKFRNEPRAKSGLLRGREFLMKDLYSFHGSEDDFNNYYEAVAASYLTIFKRCGLEAIRTLALGGIFSQFSDEFQVLAENGEDSVYLNQSGDAARNREVVENENDPEFLQWAGGYVTKKNAIEVGNIFPMAQTVSGPMQARVAGPDGQLQDVWMGCYGIGITRLVGTLAEVHGDVEKGTIQWPEAVAPYRIHLIELSTGLGAELYNQLISSDQLDPSDILYDDRDASAGTKFADADLIGSPIRVIISHRTLEQRSVELTHNDQSALIHENELIDQLTKK